MPSDEYAPVVRGALRLKGGTTSGVKKHKKKKDKKPKSEAEVGAIEKAVGEGGKGKEAPIEGEAEGMGELETRGGDGKTAAERAYEEVRRRRLQEKMQKEGIKTHKEKVEELNKYLSNLSEHHDMPRIGPG